MKYKTRVHLPSGSSFLTELDSNFKLAPNFPVHEMANKLATDEIKLEIYPESIDLLRGLQYMRDKYGVMPIDSAYRTKAYNATLKKANKNSAHLRFAAADWTSKSVLVKAKREQIAKDWQNWCDSHGIIGAIGYYSWGFHLEVHSDKWYGNKKFTVWNYL